MPAPTIPFVPRGPGWPRARGGPAGQPGMAGLGEWLDMSQVNQAAQAAPYGPSMLTTDGMAPGGMSPWDPNMATYGPFAGMDGGMGSFPNMVWPGVSGFGADPAAAPAPRGMGMGMKLALAFAAGAGACYLWCKR